MSNDIIPVIYTLRSKINEARTLEEQADVMAASLLHLDRIYGDYDDIDIVKTSKQMLADHFLHNTSEINVKSHLQMKGYDPIAREIISTQVPTATTDVELLNFKYAEASNKKQKCGDYGFSFNFDDLPMFESIDSILTGIRSPETSAESLQKLLSMDLSELVEHQLWEDILDTLSQILSTSTDEQAHTHALCILHRFAVGFKGTSQGLDTMMHILRYLIAYWILKDNILLSASDLMVKQQLALFYVVLKVAAASIQVPYQKDVERVVAAIFLILAKGELRLPPAAGRAVCTVLEALAFTDEEGGSVSALLHFVHPLTALTYAVQTGLLGALIGEHSIGSNSADIAKQETIRHIKVSVLRLRLLLSIVLGCGHNAARVVSFLEGNRVNAANLGSIVDLSRYEWKGDWRAFCAVPANSRDKTDALQPVGDSNKRFLQLTPCEPLPNIFHSDCGVGTQLPVEQVLLPWVGAQLRDLQDLLTADLFSPIQSAPTVGNFGIAAVLQLVLQLTACVNPQVHIDAVIAICVSCKNILDYLLRADDSQPSSRNAALGATITGLHAILSAEHGADVLPAVHPLLQHLMGLGLVSAGNTTGASEVVEPYLRLLDLYTSLAGPASGEIVQMCIACLEPMVLSATAENSVPLSADRTDTVGRLLQILQSACAQSATLRAVTDFREGEGALSSMIMALLTPQLLPPTTDSSARTVASILSILRTWSSSTTQGYFAVDSLVVRTILDVLREEFEDPGTFERAYDCEESSAATGRFGALFPLLIALVHTGRADVVGELLRRTWGEQIEFSPQNALCHLPKFAALVVCGSAVSAAYECECVYPYLLRILYAALHDRAFCGSVREAYAQQCTVPLPVEDEAEPESVGLTEVFSRATLDQIRHTAVEADPVSGLGGGALAAISPGSHDLLQLLAMFA